MAGLAFHFKKRVSQPVAVSGVAAAGSAFAPEVCTLWLDVEGWATRLARLRASRNSANRCSMARARPLSGVCPGLSSAAVRLRRWPSVAPARSLSRLGIFQGFVTSGDPPVPGAVLGTRVN